MNSVFFFIWPPIRCPHCLKLTSIQREGKPRFCNLYSTQSSRIQRKWERMKHVSWEIPKRIISIGYHFLKMLNESYFRQNCLIKISWIRTKNLCIADSAKVNFSILKFGKWKRIIWNIPNKRFYFAYFWWKDFNKVFPNKGVIHSQRWLAWFS